MCRGYHFDPDAEIGPKGVLCKGLVMGAVPIPYLRFSNQSDKIKLHL